MKKILLFVGNPVKDSFSQACADAYEKTAKELGAEVRRFNIEDMDFDPVLHKGYSVIQKLEPDLVAFQEGVKWANHLVFVYPNWWSTMPAKMKGVFDRCFLPKFAFTMASGKFVGLLTDKSARIINVHGSMHPIIARIALGDCINELKNGVLRICGVSPIQVNSFGPTRDKTREELAVWVNRVGALAKRDCI